MAKRKKAAPGMDDDDGSKKKKTQLTLQSIATVYNKRFGEGTIVTGHEVLRDAPRIPSGVFAVDFCTGGGMPIWRSLNIWGPPSGGKSTLAALFMKGTASICFKCYRYLWDCKCRMPKKMKSVYVDVEGTLDRTWIESLGCTPEMYMYATPDTGEAAVDLSETLIMAEDCGFLIVDSLAALVPSVELEESAFDQQMGLQSRLVAKMFRKVTSRIIKEKKKGHPVTALFINQLRAKMGGYGNPEDQPSGWAAKFAYSMSLRLGARSLSKDDKEKGDKIDKETGLIKVARSSIHVTKHKLRILGSEGEYEIAKSQVGEMSPGTILDFATTIKWAREAGLIANPSPTTWVIKPDRRFKSVVDLRDYLYRNPKEFLSMKYNTIQVLKNRGEPEDDEE